MQPKSPGCYIDGTVGAGGHARGILEACAPNGRLLGCDLDRQALAIARETLAPYGERVVLVQASYHFLLETMQQLGWEAVDGIVIDLGVSSMQFDTPERGFSFQYDAPLDMRFNREAGLTAAQLVNLAVPGGTVTEAGVRTNVSVALQYLASWLAGVGAAGINNLMEDAATAEISRAQLWQWIRHGTPLADGRVMTRALYETVRDEEVRKLAGLAHLDAAVRLLDGLVLAPDFTEFLTIPAYAELDRAQGG